MSNKKASTVNIFSSIPGSIRNELFKAYNEIVNNFIERRWEPSELNGGKLCEVVYTIIKGYVDGKIPTRSSKPRNVVDACRSLEKADTKKFPRSIRIQIPRIIIALYEIRNNRNVGHTGGDVDPNEMDAMLILYMSKWLIAELIRVFHNVDLNTATKEVEKIIARIFPSIWEVNGKLRILNTDLTMKEKTLLLLDQQAKVLTEDQLVSWLEHSNPSIYRRDILRPAHKNRLIEYDDERKTVVISPKGTEYMKSKILPKL